MSTLAMQRAFAAELHAAALSDGLAVTGDYVARDALPDAPALAVRAYVRRAHEAVGADGLVFAPRDEVWYLREDIEPQAGDRFTADGVTWINREAYREDNGLSRWVVGTAPPPLPAPDPDDDGDDDGEGEP
jgi:hypothetical protein